MKQQAVSIRIGWVIEYKGKPWTVVKATHIKPGKGGAFMQVEMKSVEEGTKTNERFRSEDTVEKLMVEEKDCQFLYEDALGLTFMDSETFEQFVACRHFGRFPSVYGRRHDRLHQFHRRSSGGGRTAAAGRLHHCRNRTGGQGTDRGFVLQTGDFGQRRPHHGSAVYQPG